MSDDASSLRAHMALDGELDAAHQLAFDEALARSPELAAEYARLRALRETIRAHAPRGAAPQRLRARIEALAAPAPAPAVWRGRVTWGALAASLAVASALGGYWAGAPHGDPTLAALVAGYQRAELSGQPVDVASSDRHTVKPWLAAHAPLGSLALDLAADGFPLIGGRIEIVEGKPVPTLVYRRGGHLISVSEFPLADSQAGPSTLDGFHVARWRDRERAYIAVSDIEEAELSAFVALFVKNTPP
jgi:anti-sigma factor RsiW